MRVAANMVTVTTAANELGERLWVTNNVGHFAFEVNSCQQTHVRLVQYPGTCQSTA